MSKICGIAIEGSKAAIVILSGTTESFEVKKVDFKKIELENDVDQNQVQSFREALLSLISTEKIDAVGIKGRAKAGEFMAGPISFKIEGIIQTIPVAVNIVHPTTIRSKLKKNPPKLTIKELGLFNYQEDAFNVAYCLL